MTTITDLIPLALGFGYGGSTNQSVTAVAVAGGFSFALVPALFFAPYIYLVTKGVRNKSNNQTLTSNSLVRCLIKLPISIKDMPPNI